MPNVKLTIEYDGTAYGGWQRQKNTLTVQQLVEEAVSRLTKEDITLIGASRTDSGVHAVGQVANFHSSSRIPPERFAHAINSLLPFDVRIRESCRVDEDFHARYSAIGKRYRYSIYNHRQGTALSRHTCYQVRQMLNVKDMIKAAGHLVGTWDFNAFRATGSPVKTTVRTIYGIDIEAKDCEIDIFVEGNAFLYNMVRIIAGTLVEVGKGKMTPEDVLRALESKKRVLAGPTAPPQGLCLLEVMYKNT